ncbi:MAG: hypothetical protein HYW70_02645 [Candidatus Nealsonbacteria bacterium]|nr:hypothetical protein [Candidatus Nealsonbacteria bacterium]
MRLIKVKNRVPDIAINTITIRALRYGAGVDIAFSDSKNGVMLNWGKERLDALIRMAKHQASTILIPIGKRKDIFVKELPFYSTQ